jgi:hypothetical protein
MAVKSCPDVELSSGLRLTRRDFGVERQARNGGLRLRSTSYGGQVGSNPSCELSHNESLQLELLSLSPKTTPEANKGARLAMPAIHNILPVNHTHIRWFELTSSKKFRSRVANRTDGPAFAGHSGTGLD